MSYFAPMLVIGILIFSFFILLVLRWLKMKKKQRLKDDKEREEKRMKEPLNAPTTVIKPVNVKKNVIKCAECGCVLEKNVEYCPYCGKHRI